MRAVVQDVDTLKALRPPDVASYLRARGWALAETVGAFTRYTLGSNGGASEIEVPRATDYGDYHLRMAEVLSTLARVEKRSQLEILQDLSVTGADVLSVRLLGTDRTEAFRSKTAPCSWIRRAT